MNSIRCRTRAVHTNFLRRIDPRYPEFPISNSDFPIFRRFELFFPRFSPDFQENQPDFVIFHFAPRARPGQGRTLVRARPGRAGPWSGQARPGPDPGQARPGQGRTLVRPGPARGDDDGGGGGDGGRISRPSQTPSHHAGISYPVWLQPLTPICQDTLWGRRKNDPKNKVFRIKFSIVENVRTSPDIILNISRGPQVLKNQKIQKSVKKVYTFFWPDRSLLRSADAGDMDGDGTCFHCDASAP